MTEIEYLNHHSMRLAGEGEATAELKAGRSVTLISRIPRGVLAGFCRRDESAEWQIILSGGGHPLTVDQVQALTDVSTVAARMAAEANSV